MEPGGLSERERNIISSKLNMRGVKSVVLIGSRARHPHNHRSKPGDYDIYLVVPFYIVPFIFKRMKFREKELEKKLGSRVSVNPLTITRIKRGKDLLVFKTKKEGITIWGNDYLNQIKIDSIAGVPWDEFFSYLFSAVFFLTECFEPKPQYLSAKKKTILHNVSKSIFYCAQLMLFMNGFWEQNRQDIYRKIKSAEFFRGKESFMEALKLALSILEGDSSSVNDALKYWLLAREILVFTLRKLALKYLTPQGNEKGTEYILGKYMDAHYPIIKKFQYTVHTWLDYREFPLFSLFDNIPVERRLQTSLFYLMLSIENNLDINQAHLNQAIKIISPLTGSSFERKELPETNWKKVKDTVVRYWPIGCAKSLI